LDVRKNRASWGLASSGRLYYTVRPDRATRARDRQGEGFVPYANLAHMFFTRAAELGGSPRYRYHDGRGWGDISWTEAAERVCAIAAALIEDGVQPGDARGVAVGDALRVDGDRPRDPRGRRRDDPRLSVAAAGRVRLHLTNAGADRVFVENAKQRAKVEQIARDGFELDGVHRPVSIRTIVTIEGSGPGTLADVLARGRDTLGRHAAELDGRLAALDRETLATIVYTSGTTGPPKGVPQTHGNHLATVEAALHLRMLRPGDVDFFFLPLAHSFARMIEYLGIASGTTTVFARSIDTLIEDLPATRPHMMPAVPRVYEKVYARIQANREQGSAVQKTVFDTAVAIGRQRTAHAEAGRPVPLWLQAADALAHQLVFSRIHAVLGGNVRFLMSGGAPLARDIAEFFHAVGLPIFEGYGLTETTPALTVNHPARFRLGTVGTVLDCCEIRIAEDGEILARGANVARGYYERPEATAEAWDAEGWFHTGDIGELDADGFLSHHRPEEGSPQDLGRQVRRAAEGREPSQAPATREPGRPDRGQPEILHRARHARRPAGRGVGARARALGRAGDLATHPEVQKLIEAEVAAANQHLASWSRSNTSVFCRTTSRPKAASSRRASR
jgi:long-chain acyl-CoA synthetase